MGVGIVQGRTAAGNPQPIEAVQDGAGNWRLRVDALLNAVAENEVNLDHANDSVAVWTNTAKDGTGTNLQPIVDADGHFQIDVLTAPAASTAGDVAHDAADSGNPVKQGARAKSFGSNPTDVADADRTNLLATRAGGLFVQNGHPNTKTYEYNTTALATNDNILPAISAGTIYVTTGGYVVIDEATTIGVSCRIGYGAASVPAEGASQADGVAGVLFSHPGMVPGAKYPFDIEGPVAGADGEEVRITCEGPTSGKLTVVWRGYTISG